MTSPHAQHAHAVPTEREHHARRPKLAQRAEHWMEGRHAVLATAIASLAETTIVPLPIELVLIPVMLTNRKRLWAIAAAALAGCLAGAALGYLVGMGAYETLAQPVVDAAGLTEQFEQQRANIADNAFRYTLVIALTPVPFQLAFLGAGAAGVAFHEFFAAAAIGRGVRYLGLALLVLILGQAAGPWLERHKIRLALWATIAVAAIYAALKLLPI